ncbi:MAG: LD-carboxypeptidase, partial [Bacteroidota bacterium]|nr:LD-carboxypeptidase [Bacteroidota bacterium]
GIFAGTDSERKHDLQWALDHPTAKVIWCYRGGYGCVRLLEDINPSRFLEKPKWIIGFSDITFFHSFSNIILNTASIHATMPINVPDNTSKSMKSLSDFLFYGSLQYEWEENKHNRYGQIEGKIVGGNLTVLCTTLGTNYQPDFEGNILFIEDIDEYYYAIDRLLWQLKFSGVFHHIGGLILGHFSKMKDNKIPFGLSLEEMVLEKVQEFDFPVAFNFPGGHENENWTIPLGVDMNFTVTENQINLSTN